MNRGTSLALLLGWSMTASARPHIECLADVEPDPHDGSPPTDQWHRLSKPPLGAERLLAALPAPNRPIEPRKRIVEWYLSERGGIRVYVGVRNYAEYSEFERIQGEWRLAKAFVVVCG